MLEVPLTSSLPLCSWTLRTFLCSPATQLAWSLQLQPPQGPLDQSPAFTPPPPQPSPSRTLSSPWPLPAGPRPPPPLPPRHSEPGWAVLQLQQPGSLCAGIGCQPGWRTEHATGILSPCCWGQEREREKQREREREGKIFKKTKKHTKKRRKKLKKKQQKQNRKDLSWDRHLPNFIINTVFSGSLHGSENFLTKNVKKKSKKTTKKLKTTKTQKKWKDYLSFPAVTMTS